MKNCKNDFKRFAVSGLRFGKDEERDNSVIKKWNEQVSKQDFVYVLGGFYDGKGNREQLKKYVSRLNGNISLIKGASEKHSGEGYIAAGFWSSNKNTVFFQDKVFLSVNSVPFKIPEGCCNLYGIVEKGNKDKGTCVSWSLNKELTQFDSILSRVGYGVNQL